MHIEELNEEEQLGERGVQACGDDVEGTIIVWDAKRVLVGAGARALFYPTLLYNVVRNKIEPEFHWWDRVDEFVLLGAVPFPADVPRLKELGVCGVVTLNEPYETLVPTSLYKDHDIDHLVIPTRDYLFAPSYPDICQAVDFIHVSFSPPLRPSTYVHCKAGRGRSTTIVLCYLVKHKNMTPEVAYDLVRSIRPRVLLASTQWQAVQNYYSCMKESEDGICKSDNVSGTSLCLPEKRVASAFDDESIVVVTDSDLDGYDETHESCLLSKKTSNNLKLACRFQFASQAAIGRLSCLWIRCQTSQEVLKKSLAEDSLTSQLEGIGVDIHGVLFLKLIVMHRFLQDRLQEEQANQLNVLVQAWEIRFTVSDEKSINGIEDISLSPSPTPGASPILRRFILHCQGGRNLEDCGEGRSSIFPYEEMTRRVLLNIAVASAISPALPSYAKTKSKNPFDERRLLEQNRRRQRENNAPENFPNFVREGFTVKVVAPDYYVKRDSGLMVWDIDVGKGESPKAGQQVTFHYVGYNESGRRIDSTYIQGSPARIRMGTNALVPGFEQGISDMKPGGKRRIIIPPELGPPVGPSTFFSSKQFEVFDVELVSIQDCVRRTIGFYSDFVCN
ncbi:OLC1v1038554C1 [Oldenlandia corymbosa var. corymbosa]|uniref:peptidylprolyl isomerase n=1 Tax=Oldenlandia corymbosa var. corymbosa TaxID=529605 RepID=A0AAV1D1K5_OLDCO|nr:OLC1v1038554C1 [Oldenlandia corymbosa var. corymbosa]